MKKTLAILALFAFILGSTIMGAQARSILGGVGIYNAGHGEHHKKEHDDDHHDDHH